MTEKTPNRVALVAKNARSVASKLAALSGKEKNQVLLEISDHLKAHRDQIEAANLADVQAAQAMLEKGEITSQLIQRLIMKEEKIDLLNTYLEQVSQLEDPVGIRQFGMRLADGLELERVSCPIGVIAIIFESRPEVVIQVTALCLKSGNPVILKGGREAQNSNRVLFELTNQVLERRGLQGAVNLIETREDVASLLEQDRMIDLIIPRGSNEFVKYIQDNTKIPVLGHSSGVCHIYVDQQVDQEMAEKVILDAKTNYPSACNAMETLLIHSGVADSFLPKLAAGFEKSGVKLKGCLRTLSILNQKDLIAEVATEKDWGFEFGDLVCSVKIVDSLEEAIAHINQNGSHHTDSILTSDGTSVAKFMSEVDSACVFHNASTRFSDGFVFGLGAEVGISTNKTHARGPVGLEGMVIYKYLLRGNGHVKGTFSGKNAQPFLHERLF